MLKRSLNQYLVVAGSLSWTAGFFLLAVLLYLDIQRSTNSTAAIGYLFLLPGAAIGALPDLVAGLCLGYALFQLRQSPLEATRYKLVLALVSAIGILVWQGWFIVQAY